MGIKPPLVVPATIQKVNTPPFRCSRAGAGGLEAEICSGCSGDNASGLKLSGSGSHDDIGVVLAGIQSQVAFGRESILPPERMSTELPEVVRGVAGGVEIEAIFGGNLNVIIPTS